MNRVCELRLCCCHSLLLHVVYCQRSVLFVTCFWFTLVHSIKPAGVCLSSCCEMATFTISVQFVSESLWCIYFIICIFEHMKGGLSALGLENTVRKLISIYLFLNHSTINI